MGIYAMESLFPLSLFLARIEARAILEEPLRSLARELELAFSTQVYISIRTKALRRDEERRVDEV